MKPLPFVLLALLFSAAGVSAAPEGAAGYVLKKRSICTLPAETRPPFWPIGWVKREKNVAQVSAAAPARAAFDESAFTLSSILIGTPSLAVINGRTYSEGEPLRAPKGGSAADRIFLRRIADGSVILQTGAQMLTVRLRRPELLLRKDEEPVLNDAR